MTTFFDLRGIDITVFSSTEIQAMISMKPPLRNTFICMGSPKIPAV
jgi:hypothetical protein